MFRGFYLGTNSCENAYFNPLKYFNSLSSLIGTMLVIHKYIYILSTSNILGLTVELILTDCRRSMLQSLFRFFFLDRYGRLLDGGISEIVSFSTCSSILCVRTYFVRDFAHWSV